MLNIGDLKRFSESESGAVTVDWVVLTAAIVGIAIGVIVLISGGINNATNDINDELEDATRFDPSTIIN